MSGEICGDNRFEVIEAAKQALLKTTNIESSPDEMKCLDGFLFRCWQMGWLSKYDETCANDKVRKRMRESLQKVKDAIETDVLYAPGNSPTYEQSEKVRVVYNEVCQTLEELGEEAKT